MHQPHRPRISLNSVRLMWLYVANVASVGYYSGYGMCMNAHGQITQHNTSISHIEERDISTPQHTRWLLADTQLLTI